MKHLAANNGDFPYDDELERSSGRLQSERYGPSTSESGEQP